jgi:hypothetical protein
MWNKTDQTNVLVGHTLPETSSISFVRIIEVERRPLMIGSQDATIRARLASKFPHVCELNTMRGGRFGCFQAAVSRFNYFKIMCFARVAYAF